MATMDYDNSSDIYPLCEKSSKIAAVVYMTETKSPYGTADYNLLKKLWNKLKFDVRQLKNPSRSVLKNWVQKLVAEINVNDTNHDVFSFTFIGHGHCRTENKECQSEYMVLRGELNDPITILTVYELREMFTASKCPGLAGKPILLILQCCRGEIQEVPVFVTATGTGVISPYSDFFTLYGSAPRHASHYNLKSGESLLITTVCEVFEKNYMNHDIMTMARTVISKINTTKLYTGYCQTAFVETSLRKMLYFTVFSGVRGVLPRAIGGSVPLPQDGTQNSEGFDATAHAISHSIISDVQHSTDGRIFMQSDAQRTSTLSRTEAQQTSVLSRHEDHMTSVNQEATASTVIHGPGHIETNKNKVVVEKGALAFINMS